MPSFKDFEDAENTIVFEENEVNFTEEQLTSKFLHYLQIFLFVYLNILILF